ncbi:MULTISPECIES: hypothetical protein [Niastella]|uniref:Sensor of ECF-type sigma factor n=1 Tax=Niastella soli TaxID=2821487 RepID=A0ABS3YQV1_9BACT|nr:hypothetical protein [Niastella soli]MBO9200284.1 hypothetical protein [Niastella soli]
MKKIILIIVMALGVSAVSLAQDDDGAKGNGSRIEALKIAYLTKKLNLSTEEAQRFWPIYNEYMGEIKKTRIDARQNKEGEIATEEKLLNIRKKYNGDFNKALSSEKVNTFFKAEKEFGTVLQKELMDRRMQKMENRRPFRGN